VFLSFLRCFLLSMTFRYHTPFVQRDPIFLRPLAGSGPPFCLSVIYPPLQSAPLIPLFRHSFPHQGLNIPLLLPLGFFNVVSRAVFAQLYFLTMAIRRQLYPLVPTLWAALSSLRVDKSKTARFSTCQDLTSFFVPYPFEYHSF